MTNLVIGIVALIFLTLLFIIKKVFSKPGEEGEGEDNVTEQIRFINTHGYRVTASFTNNIGIVVEQELEKGERWVVQARQGSCKGCYYEPY